MTGETGIAGGLPRVIIFAVVRSGHPLRLRCAQLSSKYLTRSRLALNARSLSSSLSNQT